MHFQEPCDYREYVAEHQDEYGRRLQQAFDNAVRERQTRLVDDLETLIVAKLAPPTQMARDLSDAQLQAQRIEFNGLLTDALTVTVGIGLTALPAHASLSIFSMLGHIAGAITTGVGILSAFLRRWPLQQIATWVRPIVPVARALAFAGAGTATASAAPYLVSLSATMAGSGHAWWGTLHIDVGTSALSAIALLLLGLEQRLLGRSSRALQRYRNFGRFREEQFYGDREARLRRAYIQCKSLEYFTQEEL